MDEERARSADEERDADATGPEQSGASLSGDQVVGEDPELPSVEPPLVSEGLADWLARVRRSAPGLLVGGPTMRAATPPVVPPDAAHTQPPPTIQANTATAPEPATSGAEQPVGQGRTAEPLGTDETTATLEPAPLTNSTPAEVRAAARNATPATVEPTSPESPREWPALDEPVAAQPQIASELRVSGARPPSAQVSAEVIPPPAARGRATAESETTAPVARERRIGDLNPPERVVPPGFEGQAAVVAAPRPQSVSPLAPVVVWPHDLPAPPAGAPALVVSDATVRPARQSDFSGQTDWASPWPSLPAPFDAHESVDPQTALRVRDRWNRLVREQGSA